jgi:hypothetical protein
VILLAHILGMPAEELLPWASWSVGATMLMLLASSIGGVMSAKTRRRKHD